MHAPIYIPTEVMVSTMLVASRIGDGASTGYGFETGSLLLLLFWDVVVVGNNDDPFSANKMRSVGDSSDNGFVFVVIVSSLLLLLLSPLDDEDVSFSSGKEEARHNAVEATLRLSSCGTDHPRGTDSNPRTACRFA
jgi:hypothetical protein